MKRRPPAFDPQAPATVNQLAREIGEAADIALGSAKIAKRAADSMPKPDPRDDVNVQRLAGLEQSMLARISPRHRNRWPELLAFDERIAELDRRQNELHDDLVRMRQRRDHIDQEYAAAMAAWMAAGEDGPKPVSEAAALDAAIVEGDAEYAAIDALRDRVLEERIAFVDKHRNRLVADAEREVERAKQHYIETIDALAQARDELVGLRETAVWASLYPHEALQSMAPSHALAGGRKRHTEAHVPGANQALPALGVIALLRADADYFATVSTLEQAAAMQGVSEATLTDDVARWAGSPEDDAWQKREKQRLIESYERVWGHKPAEYPGG